jgi:hypothetical protein
MKTLSTSEEYVIATRRIAGTHAEKIEQIDEAIQELLDIKLLECAADQPNLRFLAVPRRRHWFGMTMAILMMIALLILLLGVRPAHAQTAAGNAPAPQAAAAGTPAQTGTAEYKLADGFLVRGEFRRDWSNQPFFPVHGGGTIGHQNTALVGLVWWIGNKTGSW